MGGRQAHIKKRNRRLAGVARVITSNDPNYFPFQFQNI